MVREAVNVDRKAPDAFEIGLNMAREAINVDREALNVGLNGLIGS